MTKRAKSTAWWEKWWIRKMKTCNLAGRRAKLSNTKFSEFLQNKLKSTLGAFWTQKKKRKNHERFASKVTQSHTIDYESLLILIWRQKLTNAFCVPLTFYKVKFVFFQLSGYSWNLILFYTLIFSLASPSFIFACDIRVKPNQNFPRSWMQMISCLRFIKTFH